MLKKFFALGIALLLAVYPGVAFAAQNCLCVATTGTLPSTFFGFSATGLGGSHNPTMAVPTWRLWDSSTGGGGCEWANIETSPGVYDWSTCDGFTDRAVGAGNTFAFVYGRTPCSQITTPANCAGSFATGGCQKTKDLNTTNAILGNFTTAAMNHWNTKYPGVHFYLEGPNEADFTSEWCNDAGNGHGTMADLVTYMAKVKSTAKAIDPTVTIVCPASSTSNPSGVHLYGPPTGSTPSGGNGFLQQAGAAASCDVINIHMYSFCGVSASCTSTANLPATLTAIANLLSGFGLSSMPIIDTENDWGNDGANSSMSDDDRIAWDSSFAVMAWDQGHAGVWSYQWDCASGVLSSCFGTHSGSGVGAAVATANGTLQNWMIGSKHIPGSCDQSADGNGTWSCAYITPNGVAGVFIFNETGSRAFTVPNAFTTQFNLDGTSSGIVGHSVTATAKVMRIQ